jgi:hypothetical protein
MYITRKKSQIFLNSTSADLDPRIIKKRYIENNDGQSLPNLIEILTIELACLIDQRKLLEENISDIKVFISNKSSESLSTRQDLIKNSVSPRPTSPIGEGKKQKMTSRTTLGSFKSRQDYLTKLSSNKISERQKRLNLINVVYDLDNLNQNITVKRMLNLNFLTKFNVNQILGPLRIKNIQNLQQTDEELFGTKEVFEISRTNIPKIRKTSKSKNVTIDSLKRIDSEEISSIENFRNSYFKEIKLGKDPILSFQNKEDNMTLEDRLRGSKSINKSKDNTLRNYFKKIALNRIQDSIESDLSFKISKIKILKRNRICKTTFEISRNKLRDLSNRGLGGINLIFFAFDSKGKKVDSFEQKIILSNLFLTEENPSLDFKVSSSRINKGNIITHINNQEAQISSYNLYQKAFSKTQNYTNINFEKVSTDILVNPNNNIKLIDGKLRKSTLPEYSKTKTIFQRFTSNFKGSEIANTIATSVASSENESNNLSCSIYVLQNIQEDSIDIVVDNISEDVYAVLPVKRIVKNNRSSIFDPVKEIKDGQLVNVSKFFIKRQELSEEKISISFTDSDIENDTIYEYAAYLFSKSGHKQLSGSKFLEKRIKKENIVNANITITQDDNISFDENRLLATKNISFEIKLNRNEDDIDKIINSIFGDNRSLFNNDLLTIKDASNLIYGVRVHRIDTQTGDNIFVGSFRGYKQENLNSQSSTDIPKTFRVNFTDNPPAFSRQIYRFDPYVIPPSQVLDKVFTTLENIIKNNPNSRSTLNKILVSKQKILNKNIISQVGTKISSIQGDKGTINTVSSILQNNRNDLFLEGLTGDVIYSVIEPRKEKISSNKIEILNSSIGLIKTLDRNSENKNYIPKNIIEINFDVSSFNTLIDFYVILKQTNKDTDVIIDGCIHSIDIVQNINQNNSYRYLSEVKTSVGLIKYYLFGITKHGTMIGPSDLGSIILEGE